MLITITQDHIDQWRETCSDDRPPTMRVGELFLVFEFSTVLVISDGRAFVERMSDELFGFFQRFNGGENVKPIEFEIGGSIGERDSEPGID